MRYRNQPESAEAQLLAKLTPAELVTIAEAAQQAQQRDMRAGLLLGVAVGAVAMYALGRWGIIKCK